MIIEPDFVDHWKTRLLVRLLGTELAPVYVLRLWSHCQTRKTDRFTGWKPAVLSAVCHWDGNHQVFWDAMTQTYLTIDGDDVVAHDWAKTNNYIVSAWFNGAKGGRPSKPVGNRQVTDRIPTGYPDGNRPVTEPKPDENRSVTEAEPVGNRTETYKIREEKIREEKTTSSPSAAVGVDGFDAFWEAYPAKKAKQSAIKVWNRLKPSVALREAILSDLSSRVLSNEWTKDGGQFIPHPATYLNQKRWEDEVVPVPPPNFIAKLSQKPAWVQAKELRSKLATHPGNYDYIGNIAQNITLEQYNEYLEIKRQLDAIEAGDSEGGSV